MRRPLACFFVSMGWKRSAGTRSLHPADAVLRRVWEAPNKYFCPGPGGHGAKIATWYQVALLAHSALRKKAQDLECLCQNLPQLPLHNFGQAVQPFLRCRNAWHIYLPTATVYFCPAGGCRTKLKPCFGKAMASFCCINERKLAEDKKAGRRCKLHLSVILYFANFLTEAGR